MRESKYLGLSILRVFLSIKSLETGTQNQFGISWAAVCVCGQTGNRTNAGRATTPFMFNEEGYRVSNLPGFLSRKLTVFIVCS